jgi:hypothetical protein
MPRIFIAIFILLPAQAWAWGNFGHQVVGEIASRHLCPKTTRAVAELLGRESLADASTWADEIRSQPEFKFTKPWHFVTMKLDSTYDQAPKAPRGDLVTAYHEQVANLQSRLYPKRDEALKLLLHFVGDAHQPFHAGQHSDSGGNGVILTWFGNPSNLHQVWDSRMLWNLHQSYTELANAIDTPAAPTPSQKTPEDWVNESSKIAAEVYPETQELGYAYHDKFNPIVKDRLHTAGLRLANLLNGVFGCN